MSTTTTVRTSSGQFDKLDRVSFNWVMWGVAIFSLIVLTMPTLIVLIASFSSAQTLRFPPTGFSLQWYIALFNYPELWSAAITSFQAALWTTLICIVLGVCASLAMAGSRARWVAAMDALVMSPLALPGIAVGLGILTYFSLLGIRLSLITLVISHVVICIPYLLRTTLASLIQLGTSLREASTVLGASPVFTFFHVTLPLIKQGVITGAFMSFLTSFDNITVSLFLSDARTEVLPIRMWSMIENDLDVRAAAISGILIVITALLMVLMERVSGLSKFLVKS
ncbi:binding-protein-dependent transport systems inner membrane component [Gloeocapsa sp. PCC 7428]|uniref:ABC transporter permease n=1 Tax=Gloeocapsa sp. PCC 7428 TaxID=1173026 RepID=UPI0002A5EB96|nr:ABC transporter permease [Gloeocapsa sp. PCC 7428]AFZ32688.1 binding-protein-dependent transport systems inner membrane component [Gloeocapsa sp. PCC 7428]